MATTTPTEGDVRHGVLLVEDEEATRHYLAEAIGRHPALDVRASCSDLASARAALALVLADFCPIALLKTGHSNGKSQ